MIKISFPPGESGEFLELFDFLFKYLHSQSIRGSDIS